MWLKVISNTQLKEIDQSNNFFNKNLTKDTLMYDIFKT